MPAARPRRARLRGAATLSLALAAGCASSSTGSRIAPPFEASFAWTDLRFTVSVLPTPADRVHLLTQIRNEAAWARRASIPLCFPWVRAYRERRLAWESEAARACEGMSRWVELGAGEEESRYVTLLVDEILGDSLPEGEYDLALYVAAASRPGEPPRAPMELSLGRIQLTRHRPWREPSGSAEPPRLGGTIAEPT